MTPQRGAAVSIHDGIIFAVGDREIVDDLKLAVIQRVICDDRGRGDASGFNSSLETSVRSVRM